METYLLDKFSLTDILLNLEKHECITNKMAKDCISNMILAGKKNPSLLELKELGKVDGGLFLTLVIATMIETQDVLVNKINSLESQIETLKSGTN